MNRGLKLDDSEMIKNDIVNELINILHNVVMFSSDNENLSHELIIAILYLKIPIYESSESEVISISDKYLYINFLTKNESKKGNSYDYNTLVINRDSNEFYFSKLTNHTRKIEKYVIKDENILQTTYDDDFGLFQNNSDERIDLSIKNLQYLVEIK